MERALLVVDVQSGLVEKPLHEKERFLTTIDGAIRAYRGSGSLVVFIQHCGGAVKKGKPGWEIYPALDRRAEDPVVPKEHGDAFKGTGLGTLLAANGVQEILVCGLVTHGCVRATCLGGAALGLRVRLLENGHSNWAKDAAEKIEAVERELAAAGIEVRSALSH
jgi:nicotinamidase-related amidase